MKINKSDDNSLSQNRVYLSFLAWVLLSNVLLEFVNTSLMRNYSLTNTSLVTFVIYIIFLIVSIYIIFKYRGITFKQVSIYFLTLIFFALNYFLFENSRDYLIDKSMFLIYLFFIPIAIFIIEPITKWDEVLTVFPNFAYIAVLLSTFGITVIGFSDYINYMEFSYSLLPFNLILYYSFRQSLNILNFIIFNIGFVDILLFGARAPVLFLILFIVSYEIIRFTQARVTSKICIIMICGFLVITLTLFSDEILTSLLRIAEMTDSRFITKMLNDELMESFTRNSIYEDANYVILNMGMDIYGLFGDRQVVNSIYVHNIFYELLLSFGYILGSLSIFALIYLILKATVFNTNTISRIIAMLFTAALFLRYLVSGSFVIEGKFYIYIAILLSIYINQKKMNNEKD